MRRRKAWPPDTAMLLEIIRTVLDESRYEAAVTRIEEIERRHVAAAPVEERLLLRQEAARWAFIAATDRGGSFEDVSLRFTRICEVGFAAPSSECAVLLEFADACASFGRWEEGLRILAQARDRLPAWGFKRQAEVEERIERIQRRLERGLKRQLRGSTHRRDSA